MNMTSRHEEILGLLRIQGAVEVDSLAHRFGVTTQTIRNDLALLGRRGLIQRTHGGARRLMSVSSRDYAERRSHRGAAKQAIGCRAAGLIPNDCSIALNIGTTTEQVAHALNDHSDLMVLSNNINIINLLTGCRSMALVQVGGRVRQRDGAVVGEDAVEFISRYKVDYAIIGASSLDADGAILDFDVREVSVARAILQNSRTRILVCDSSKFETRAPVRICDIRDVDYFVTDLPPPDSFAVAAEQGRTSIMVANVGD